MSTTKFPQPTPSATSATAATATQPALMPLLTPKRVAEITGLSEETLAQWRSQKRGIPYLKLGRRALYHPADVQRYLASCRVTVSDPHERRQ